MMTTYILKLIILIPLVGGLAYGSLWLWRRVQPGMAFSPREQLVRIVDATPLGATGRLAVVDFGQAPAARGLPHRRSSSSPKASRRRPPRSTTDA